MGTPQRLGQHGGIDHLVELADVGAGDKAALLAGLDDEADHLAGRNQILDPEDRRFELGDRQPAQRIHRRIRRVDGEPADLLDIDLEAPVDHGGHLRLCHWTILLFGRPAAFGAGGHLLGSKLVELEIVDADDAVRRLVGKPQHRGLGFGEHASIDRISDRIAIEPALDRRPS